MSFDHAYEQALQQHNGAVLLEGNQVGPPHPQYREHRAHLEGAKSRVHDAFHALMQREGVDVGQVFATAHSQQLAETIADHRAHADSARQVLAEAKKLPAAQGAEKLKRHLGDGGWRATSRAELARRTESAISKHETSANHYEQHPESYGLRDTADSLAAHLPEHLRPVVKSLPGDVLSDFHIAHAERLRQSRQPNL